MKKSKKETNSEKNMDKFFEQCFLLAILGHPAPNPYVGAVIEFRGKIIGKGFHSAAGNAHAEVEAIMDVKRKYGAMAKHVLSNSTLYVNLEPCNHTGRQPPCSLAIIKEKIPRVAYALKDPNTKAAGGAKMLEKNGVQAIAAPGKWQKQATCINLPFIKRVKSRLPYVTLKMALSKNLQASTNQKERWISSEKSRMLAHLMRDKVQAIMAGIGTIKADNPQLTCRFPKGGHDPLRVIVDPYFEIDEKALVLADKNALIVCSKNFRKGIENAKDEVGKKKKAKMMRLQKRGISFFFAPQGLDGNLLLKPLLSHLASIGIDHVLVEGGPRLAASMIGQKLVDEVVLIRSPKATEAKEKNKSINEAIRKIVQFAKENYLGFEKIGCDRVEFSKVGKEKLSFWRLFIKLVRKGVGEGQKISYFRQAGEIIIKEG